MLPGNSLRMTVGRFNKNYLEVVNDLKVNPVTLFNIFAVFLLLEVIKVPLYFHLVLNKFGQDDACTKTVKKHAKCTNM